MHVAVQILVVPEKAFPEIPELLSPEKLEAKESQAAEEKSEKDDESHHRAHCSLMDFY